MNGHLKIAISKTTTTQTVKIPGISIISQLYRVWRGRVIGLCSRGEQTGRKKPNQVWGAIAAKQHLETLDESPDEDDNDEKKSPMQLMYGTVRSYVSAIRDFRLFRRRAFINFLTSKEHIRKQEEYVDCGLGTMKDGYLQLQIPNVTHQV